MILECYRLGRTINVVGLPLREVLDILVSQQVIVPVPR